MMPWAKHLWIVCLLLPQTVVFAQGTRQPRFAARFADGSRTEGNSLLEWNVAPGTPKLEGKPLLDANNPMLWLRDRSLAPGPAPKAFVEFAGGDCLPGQVVGFSAAGEASFDADPPHFLVKPDVPLRPPQSPERPEVRVASRFVRRIVWQRLGKSEFRPGTVFFRDGRSAPFRSARFADGSIHLLLAEGPRKAAYNDLAEIHFPAVDFWESYYEELVGLGTNSKTRLLQLETTEGLAATSALDRLAVHVVGNPADPSRWVHGLQPVWSLDMLWIPCNSVWMRRLFVPHEPPLSRAAPSANPSSSLAGVRATYQINRNEHGGPLRGGSHDFGWGWGVHAPSELKVALPDCVQGVRSFVGLDRAVGKGGCVWARVFVDATDTSPLFESGYLVGSDQVSDTGMIPLVGPAGGQKSLVLQIDAAHAGRPQGADPLDIRDSADWLDPVLVLDPTKLQAELDRRRAAISPAWKDWTVRLQTDGPPEQAGALETSNYVDELTPSPGAVRLGVYARIQPFSLSREIEVGPRDQWLIMAVHQQINGGQKTRLEVLINGEPIAEYTIPPRNRDQRTPPPLAVPLANYRGHKVQVEIRQHPAAAPALVYWQALRVVEQLPTLHELFTEEGAFVALDESEGGEASLVEDDRHSGQRSLKVTPAGRFQLKLGEPLAIRERPAWGEYRYLRFAFRKFGKGRMSIELNHAAPDAKPARYDAGTGDPAFGQAKRVWTLDLPSEWIVMTRDLYADFGPLDVSGITLSAVDGEYALFDHIYLARTDKDFELASSPVSAEAANQKARRELAKETLKKILPASVGIEFGEGRFGAGAVFTPDGYILTAGHLVVAPKRDVTVHLADGREVAGKTRGVYRELDIGVVKLNENGPWPFVDLNPARDVPIEQLFIGVAHGKSWRPKTTPAAHVVGIRRMFRGQIWSDFDLDEFSTGGPLVDRDGRLVGVHNRRSQFGGFMFSRLDETPPLLERIKQGELIGAWYSGTGPAFGATVAPGREGARITALDADGPAAKAGLQLHDVLLRVKGKPVVGLEDIHFALADSDPGQELVVEFSRNNARAEAKLTLAPRLP